MTIRIGAADLMARYQRYADTGRIDDLIGLFAADAVFETNTAVHTGRDQILAFFTGVGVAFAASGVLPARHHLSSILVELRPDGTASTYACFAWIGTSGLDHWGTYRDEVAEVDGRWQFRRRRATVEGYVATSTAVGLLGFGGDAAAT